MGQRLRYTPSEFEGKKRGVAIFEPRKSVAGANEIGAIAEPVGIRGEREPTRTPFRISRRFPPARMKRFRALAKCLKLGPPASTSDLRSEGGGNRRSDYREADELTARHHHHV